MLHNTPDGSRETPHNENINVSAEKHRSLHYVEFKKKRLNGLRSSQVRFCLQMS